MNSNAIKIGDRLVGGPERPLIIAEMSGNHNGSLDRALLIVEAAAKAGADALKIQTYTADTMTIDLKEGEFVITDEESQWNDRSLYELYQEAATPWEWHKPILDRARELGMIAFSTPFDESAVDFLETLDVPCYKIASFELTDIPLIRKVAATGKPLIMSTGMASVEEIKESVQAARDAGCKNIVLLKCTSTYPADPIDSNINTIPDMREMFNCQVGLSDHTLGIGVAVASVALGATVIEKHVTLSRADGGVDAAFSLEPNELTLLVAESRKAWQSLGQITYGGTQSEAASMNFRRSLYIVRDLKVGDSIGEEDIRAIRPGHGLPPKYIDQVLGKRLKKSVSKGTPVSWELFD